MNLFEESEEIVIFDVETRGNLEKFLFSKNISGRLLRQLDKRGHIFINGEKAKRKAKLKVGDRVSIFMEEESNDFELEKMDLDIIYEDIDILVVNKKPFMVVHPTKSHEKATLANGIAYYFREKGINRKIRFVNRLDMNTSGILIVAKNPFAHQQLSLQFENNTVEKRYRALVSGIVEKNEDFIDLHVLKKEGDIRQSIVESGGKALTKYQVIERYMEATLLDIQIFTGKTHQIRVHMNSIGHPIIGDTLYSEESPHIKRQALQSYYLKIKNPRSGKDIELFIDMPADFRELIKHLSI